MYFALHNINIIIPIFSGPCSVDCCKHAIVGKEKSYKASEGTI